MSVSHMLQCHHTLSPTDTLKYNTLANNTTIRTPNLQFIIILLQRGKTERMTQWERGKILE